MKISVCLLLLLSPAVAAFGRDSSQPRIFMTPEQVRAARTDGPRTDIQRILRDNVVQLADESLNKPLFYIQPGTADRLRAGYRPWPTVKDSEMLYIRKDARDTDALALAYALTGNAAYADKAWENVRVMLTAYEAFGSFHPHRENNDLAAAHAYMALAMTWDLCADKAPEATRRLVLTEGVRRARMMYDTAVSDWLINGLPVPFATPRAPEVWSPFNRNIFAMLNTNHCWIDVALLGCLALVLEDQDISAAGPGSGPKDWLKFSIHFFDYLSRCMSPDGSYPESRVYGGPYAQEAAAAFLPLLKRVKGIDLYRNTTFFHNFGLGTLYAVWDHPAHGGIANFGEGGNHEWQSPAWMYALAREYRDPALQWSADCWTRRKPASDVPAWQYLSYDPNLAETRPDSAGLPRAIFMGDVSHVHVRGGGDPWGGDDRVLSFRGSIAGKLQYQLKFLGRLPYISTWHMHLSRNAVQLAVRGSALIGRTSDYTDGTGYYSVLQVDGRDQSDLIDYGGGLQNEVPGQSINPSCAALPGVTDFEATDSYVTFSNEIGAVYPGLELYRRRVVCLEPDLYLVFDHARAPRPVRMDFRLHFGRDVSGDFTPAASDSPARVRGSVAGVPFSCDIISRESLAADFTPVKSYSASNTLQYGPPDSSAEYRVVAVIGLDNPATRVRALELDPPDCQGALVEKGDQALAVVAADLEDIDSRQRPRSVSYVVPVPAAAMRHLVAGLVPSGQYAVHAERAPGGFHVLIAPGDGFAAGAAGTLLFELAPDGRILPVPVTVQPEAQAVATKFSGK